MEARRNNRGQTRSKYIQLDTRKCKACWKCVEACPNNVIGTVNLPWHKHALIINSDNCSGCTKCIKACEFMAISKISSNNDTKINQKNPYDRFIINIGLLLTGFIAVYSGFLIQFSYHMGHHGEIDINRIVLNINYSGWTNIHKIAITLLSVLMVFHTVQHWKWYKTIVKKNLVTKNIQVFILSTVFILVAITGFIPWTIDLTGNDQITRKIFLEIHDKLTIILFIFLILHVMKRLKWFTATLRRSKNIQKNEIVI